MRLLFFIRHAGYLRHYGPVIRVLADRGHRVHVAFSVLEKDPGDARLAEELAGTPGVTYGLAPQRPVSDPWRGIAFVVRAFIDLARYVDPRWANAPRVRARVAENLETYFRSAARLDPLTRRLCLRLVRLLHRRSSAPLASFLVRALMLVERGVPTSPAIDDFVLEHEPDAVLVTPVIELASTQVEYLKSARSLGTSAAVCVASWDNLTGKGLIRVVPDRVIVWNDFQRREAVELHRIPYARVVLTGAQRFDEWFERRPSTIPAEFAAKVGLGRAAGYLLYLCSSPFIAPDEVTFVEEWIDRLRRDDDRRLRTIGVLVRPHPQNALQWQHVDLSRFGNVSIWPRGGAQPDAGEARADFYDSLAHSAAVVGVNTSALIEAAILEKRVYSVLTDDFRGTQEGTLHFHYLLRENGGFLSVARSLEEHLEQLRDAVASAGEPAAETSEFVRSFVRPHGLERPATPLVADAIEELARSEPLDPRRPPPAALALRLLLVPAVAAVRVLYAAGERRRDELADAPSSVEAKRPPEQRRPRPTKSPEAARINARLDEVAASGTPLVLGAWTRGEEEELLYWIPFLRWARDRYGLDPARTTAVAAPGTASWYADIAARRVQAAPAGAMLAPELLVDLCAPLWRGEAPIRSVLDRLTYARLTPPPNGESLPSSYVVADFSFGDRYPDTAGNRAAAEQAVAALERETAVVSLNGDSGRRMTVLGGAGAFVGSWNVKAVVALSLGIPTVAIYSGPQYAASVHADVVYRAARALEVPFALVEVTQLANVALVAAAARRVAAA